MLQINASFVQGSRIDPIYSVLNTSDLHHVFPENRFNKYADDTYMVVPASNSHTIDLKKWHVSEWAHQSKLSNSLRRNTTKSVELITHRPGAKLDKLSVRTVPCTPCSRPYQKDHHKNFRSLTIADILYPSVLTLCLPGALRQVMHCAFLGLMV